MVGEDDPYSEPDLYDLEYADHDEDLQWYRNLARSARGAILELGCGTGRLTLPMARQGRTVVGIDAAAPMLEQLNRKLQSEAPEVRLRTRTAESDFRNFALDQRFALIVWPFNAIHHCASTAEIEAVLERVQAHLLPGGQLAVDAYLPDLTLYDRDPGEKYEPRDFIDPRGGSIKSWEQGWWEPQGRVHHVVYTYESTEHGATKAHLKLHMYERPELEETFRRSGFEQLEAFEDFQRSPLRRNSLKWVARYRTRGSR